MELGLSFVEGLGILGFELGAAIWGLTSDKDSGLGNELGFLIWSV